MTAYFFAGLEQAVPLVTAIQFGRSDVTTLARPCQSIKLFPLVDRPVRSCSTGTKSARLNLKNRPNARGMRLPVHVGSHFRPYG